MEHELGTEAIEFCRGEFSYGGALAKRLIAIPSNGKILALLPDDASPAELIDFQSGGVATGDEAHELADIVRLRLSVGADRICVFEHPTLRTGDPRMPPLAYFTVGDSVYLFLSHRSDHETVVKAARETHWYPSIGVISTIASGQPFPESGSALIESFLDDLTTRVSVIVVGAYDAESWLVWLADPAHGRSGDVAT
jgi:hypothetical protein